MVFFHAHRHTAIRARALLWGVALLPALAPIAVSAADYKGYSLLWSRQSYSVKIAVTAFMVEGVTTGYNANRSDGKTLHFKKPIGDYVKLIDDFYGKNPTARSATPSEVLLCLADTPVYDCEELAKTQT